MRFSPRWAGGTLAAVALAAGMSLAVSADASSTSHGWPHKDCRTGTWITVRDHATIKVEVELKLYHLGDANNGGVSMMVVPGTWHLCAPHVGGGWAIDVLRPTIDPTVPYIYETTTSFADRRSVTFTLHAEAQSDYWWFTAG